MDNMSFIMRSVVVEILAHGAGVIEGSGVLGNKVVIVTIGIVEARVLVILVVD